MFKSAIAPGVTHLVKQVPLRRVLIIPLHRRNLLREITDRIRSEIETQQVFETAANAIGRAFQVGRCLIDTYLNEPVPMIPVIGEYLSPGHSSIKPRSIY